MKRNKVNPKTAAIILAGGSGERFESNIPKQFVNLNGKPVIQHSIDVFKQSVLALYMR